MARPREFDPDHALEQAMQVFWKHGYEGASLTDLLNSMGLTRGSLYKAFTDKRSLFLLVLTRYEQGAVAQAVELLSADTIPNGITRIEALFDTVTGAVAEGDRRGCLLCSTAAGPSAYDADIAAAVKRGLDDMRGGFLVALEASNAPMPNHPALADLLVTQYVGLRIMARSLEELEPLTHASAAIKALLHRA